MTTASRGRRARRFPPTGCVWAWCLVLCACGARGPHEYRWSVMGTSLRVVIVGEPASRAAQAAQEAFRVVAHLDSVFSIYKPSSDFSRINAAAGRDTVVVHEETVRLLEACQEFWRLTGGAFDASVGPLMRLWKLQGEGYVPSEGEIDSVLPLVGFQRVVLLPESRRVFLPEGMRLDPGGIGKGYAVDAARAALARRGIRRCLVDLGGNVGVLGRGPHGRPWNVGIRNPLAPGGIIATLEVEDMALATSGQYEQYFVRDGVRYGHIVDPLTGRPATGMLSATIVAPDATTTDGLSTGVFVMGVERGMALVESLPGVEAVLVLDPGVGAHLTRAHVRVSRGLRGRLRWAIP